MYKVKIGSFIGLVHHWKLEPGWLSLSILFEKYKSSLQMLTHHSIWFAWKIDSFQPDLTKQFWVKNSLINLYPTQIVLQGDGVVTI